MRSIRVAAVLLLAGGCASAPPPPPAPALPDPVAACTNQLSYWAGEELRDADRGFDYQEMGLNSSQNDALTAVVAAARREGPSVVERIVHDACVRLAAEPSSSPWGY